MISKKSLLLFTLILHGFTLLGQNKYSTYYYQRASLFEKLPICKQDIVFVGNSITDGGEWSELFNSKHIKNRGISGDICDGVYDRLDNILSGKPSKIFLLIGINDIARGGNSDSIVIKTAKILDKIALESPKTKIYLQSILPVNDSFGLFKGHTSRWSEIKPLNEKLKLLSFEKAITFIDLYSFFVLEGTEKLNPKYTNDGLHLLGEGYIRWSEILKPYINRKK